MKKSQNILLSGGNGLLGYSISKYLLKNGNKLVIGDKIFSKTYNKYNINKELFLYKSDLTKEKNINNFIKYAKKKLGKIDVFIHCLYPKTKDWGKNLNNLNQHSLNKNLSDQLGSPLIFAKYLIRHFLEQKKGNLIFFSSIYGFSTPNFEDYDRKVYSPVEYGAIKAGIISLTKYLAKFYKNKGLKINCISPGGIIDKQEKKFVKNYKKRCNSKGLLKPDDINSIINFMISKDSDYINGQNIIIDDGWSL